MRVLCLDISKGGTVRKLQLQAPFTLDWFLLYAAEHMFAQKDACYAISTAGERGHAFEAADAIM